ncbi:ferredoxin-type protein NapF [Roseibium sp. HPY-6]|uniref:ferredoxin-type protein NapF n=1 Tax=Roseibium sp. HPY-6 TaxID=3229852 RepID=UPI00338E33E9
MPDKTEISVSRRAFLKLSTEPKVDGIRPPWAAENSFSELCTGCNDCVRACPEKIIVSAGDQGPVLDFSHGACTFCGACADICPTGALDPSIDLVWPWKAVISNACLSRQGITCRACEDVCEPRTIRFRLTVGGRSEPVLDFGQCTGCGACSYACPADAVSFEKIQLDQEGGPT